MTNRETVEELTKDGKSYFGIMHVDCLGVQVQVTAYKIAPTGGKEFSVHAAIGAEDLKSLDKLLCEFENAKPRTYGEKSDFARLYWICRTVEALWNEIGSWKK